MRVVERLDEVGNPSGDFSPTFEAADILAWCKANNYSAGIAEMAIRQSTIATDMARDETGTIFWPTAATIANAIECAQAELLETAEWPPQPAPLPEITEATAKERRKHRKGQSLITNEGLV
jgi:hypothetical protein